MNAFYKKMLPWVGLSLVLIAAGIIKFYMTEHERILPDFLPVKTDLWLWQQEPGVDPEFSIFLAGLGVAPSVGQVMEKNVYAQLVYFNTGKWYQLAAPGRGVIGPFAKYHEWLKTIRLKDNQLFGYLSADNAAKLITDLGVSKTTSAVFFILTATESGVRFTIIPADAAAGYQMTGSETEITTICPALLSLRIDDYTLQSTVSSKIKELLVNDAASGYPVVVKTELPDKTWITERVLKSDVWAWQAVDATGGAGIFRLAVDQTLAEQAGLADQLAGASASWYIFEGQSGFIVDTDEAVVQSCVDAFKNQLASYFLLDLAKFTDQQTVDTLGTSAGLGWLKDQGFGSIMIYEDESGIIEGVLVKLKMKN